MRFRNLNSGEDWTFGKGKNNYVFDNKAIQLNIKTRLLSWVNDCFFDLENGIDWINRLGLKNQQELLESDLRNVILKTDGVRNLVSLSTNFENRAFSATYTVNTIYSKEFTDSLERAI